jgi:hypothetical protein
VANPRVASGFLPPANATAPAVAAGTAVSASETYRDLRIRALLATRWLRFSFALALVALVLDVLWLRRQAAGTWTYEDWVTLTDLIDTVALVQLVVLLIGAAIFIAWFQRGYTNLAVLSRSKPRWSRGWAIGGWFIPLVSLVIPKQIANDLWRAGEAGARVPGFVHWWWALFLVASAASRFAARAMDDSPTIEQLRDAILIDAIAQGLTAVSALTAIAVVAGTSRRQKARAQTLGLFAEGAAS